MGSLRVALLAGALLVSCDRSEYGRCKTAANFEPAGLQREMALDRCEQVANRELQRNALSTEHARQDEREAAADAREQRNAERLAAEDARNREQQRVAISRKLYEQQEAIDRPIRSDPRAPEIGSTPKESAAICYAQGGVSRHEPGSRQVCRVGGWPIYEAHTSPSERFDVVGVFYEGADIAVVRGQLEAKHGPPDRMVVEDGFRVWRWDQADPRIDARMYERGVSVRFKAVRPPDAPQPAAPTASSTNPP